MTPIRDIARSFNKSLRSSAEGVPWLGLVSPQLVINSDGSLLAGFEYVGYDYESTGIEERDAGCAAIEVALQAFDDRNVVWTFLDKRRHTYSTPSTITNAVARYFDDAWKATIDAGQLARVRTFIYVSFQPFGAVGGFYDEVSAQASQEGASLPKAMTAVLMQRLRRRKQIERLEGRMHWACAAFEEQLAAFAATISARMRIERLHGDALVSDLSNRVNLATPRTRVQLPDQHVFLNTFLPTDTMTREAGGVLRFDGAQGTRYARHYTIKGYPESAINDHVEAALAMPVDFTLTQMFRVMDREKAKRFIQDQESHYRANVKGPIVSAFEKITGLESDRVNHGMAVLANDAQAALVDVTVNNVNYGYHSMVLQVVADTADRAAAGAAALTGLLTNYGYGVIRENVGVLGALAATRPGASDLVLRQAPVSTRNLADLTIVRALSAGADVNAHLSEQSGRRQDALMLMRTSTDVPFHFNFHVKDVGHFIVVGGVGAGKSTFVNVMITMFQRHGPCRVIAIDKARSNWITIDSLGGNYVRIDPAKREGEAASTMSPMKWLKREEDLPRLRRWLEVALLAFDARPLTVDDVQVLDRTLALLRAEHGTHTLSSLYFKLRGARRELADRLQVWIDSGRYGHLFDHEHDEMRLSDVTGLDVGTMLDDPHLAPTVLAYLFEVIEESLTGDVPTFIYLEEAAYLLKDETFRNHFEEWLRNIRKRNGFCGLSTQAMADARDSPIAGLLNESIKTRVFLPNLQARDSMDIYMGMFGLREHEVEVIRNAVQKRHYYIVQDTIRRLVDLELPANLLALTRSDERALAAYARLRAGKAPTWLNDYVQEMVNG